MQRGLEVLNCLEKLRTAILCVFVYLPCQVCLFQSEKINLFLIKCEWLFVGTWGNERNWDGGGGRGGLGWSQVRGWMYSMSGGLSGRGMRFKPIETGLYPEMNLKTTSSHTHKHTHTQLAIIWCEVSNHIKWRQMRTINTHPLTQMIIGRSTHTSKNTFFHDFY